MTIYFIMFITSYLCCVFGERLNKKKKKQEALFMLFFAVLFPAILAGCRDYTIGTDIATYGHWLFVAAKRSTDPLKFALSNTSIDLLYSFFVYFISHLFYSEHWLYFFTGVIIYGFTMAGIYRYRKIISISMAWLCFLLLFYGDTLNAMRQCIAMSILLFAFSYFQTGNKKKFILLSVVAFLFHVTAIIVVAFVGVYSLLKKSDTLKMKIGILLFSTIIMVEYAKIISFAVSVGILNDKFLKYGIQMESEISLNPIMIRLPYLLFIVLFYNVYVGGRKNTEKKMIADFSIMMILIEMATAEMRTINSTLYRVSLYFGMYRYIGIGRLIMALKSANKRIVIYVIWALLILTWIYQNVIQGNNQIYPFKSELLGI